MVETREFVYNTMLQGITSPAAAQQNAVYEAAIAYIMDVYDIGLILLKQDDAGNFHELHTIETPAASAPYFTVVPCP